MYFCVDLEHDKHHDSPVLPQLTSEQPRLLQRRATQESSSKQEQSGQRSNRVVLVSLPSDRYPRLDFSTNQRLPPISKVPRASPSILNHQNPPTMQLALPPINCSKGRCGLANTRNTCYINSALQCLNSIPGLVEWVRQQPPPTSISNVIDSYVALVQSMWSGRSKVVDPRELKDWVTCSAPIFSGTGQKDAHEFMNSLLNAIESIDPLSPIVSLFRIHTQSTVLSEPCQHRNSTNATTTFLSLPFPEISPFDHRKISLVRLIKDFCKKEEMNGHYHCEECQKYQLACQQTTIVDPLPQALVIQLKRFPFNGTNRKIGTFIRYKVEYQNLLSNDDRYTLSAVITHDGSLSSGHYTTMARDHRNNRWYRYDDRYVDKMNPKEIPSALITPQAYVLVYCKQYCSDVTSSTAFWLNVFSIFKYILQQDPFH